MQDHEVRTVNSMVEVKFTTVEDIRLWLEDLRAMPEEDAHLVVNFLPRHESKLLTYYLLGFYAGVRRRQEEGKG